MTLVLDSSAIIAYLRNEPGAEIVEAALMESEATAFAHAINVMEAYYDLHRHGGVAAGEEVLAFLAAGGVRILEDLDMELWKDAAVIKSRFRKVSLADCIGVALTRRLSGTFVTSDRHEFVTLELDGAASFTFVR